MATLDATLAELDFTTGTAFSSVSSATATEFYWLTTGLDRIEAHGTGLTYNGNVPLSGTVTSIGFNFQHAGPGGSYAIVDATITGISVDLTLLTLPSNPALGEARFWETVMGGDDTILAPLMHGGRMTGDFARIDADPFDLGGTYRTGGNDTFEAHNGAWTNGVDLTAPHVNVLTGDALAVKGATISISGHLIAVPASLTGGDDTFNVSDFAYFAIVGDVQLVDTLGEVYGGADTINSTVQDRAVDPRLISYAGDVEVNYGDVFGGNDRIIGSNSSIQEYLAGDVLYNMIGGFVQGGNDFINGRGGNHEIIGDIGIMEGGRLTGGDDVLRSGAGGKSMAGDVFNVFGPSAAPLVTIDGGRDTITGSPENDSIAGDVFLISNVDQASSINGGNDVLFGGRGDDILFGDINDAYIAYLDSGGNDVLDGGLGNDFLLGQLGRDTAAFGSVARAVKVDLAAGTAIGQGNDILSSIENATGSSRNDVLRGDDGANQLDGGDGDDTLIGRGGRDTLTGGLGRDSMSGGARSDTFLFKSIAESGITATDRDLIIGWDESDFISLTKIDANTDVAGNQDFAVVTAGAPAAGEVRIVATATGWVLRINTDADADLEMTIAIQTTHALTAANILV